jgi:hypothetical protein
VRDLGERTHFSGKSRNVGCPARRVAAELEIFRSRTTGGTLADQPKDMKTFAFWILSFFFLFAAQKSTSALQGMVTVGNGAFSGVEVEASSSGIDQFWETSTDGSGRYILNELPPGRYTVWAEATGHGCIVKSPVMIKDASRSIQNFHFSKGKRYPGCESLKPRKR